MKSTNGHRSWNAWNVALWISNDYDIYNMVLRAIEAFGKDRAVNELARVLKYYRTPDGAIYNRLSIKLAIEDF